MLSFFRRPVFVIPFGFSLFALFVWIAGPFFAFGSYQPLLSVAARLIVIAVVVIAWLIWRLVKALRANRASDKLMEAVVTQKDPAAERPTAEAQQLREKFEEAIGLLKQQRRRGHSLYDLPWYVIIGAPGSGKTTALVNSGLHFPFEQRSGRGALRGVGGTRNCDWWFTNEAVLLDTAGRYTTQDSDASADSAAWIEFLALLKKYRKRRPVNGVILTISADDLIGKGRRDREAHVTAARRRLDELNRELRIQLPVYLMVTKTDLVAGFTEYFEDLEKEGRAQVWGVTFPYDRTLSGEAAQMYPAEFDALITRLNERVFQRLDEERDLGRRAKAFGFPQQMTALREALCEFVNDVFATTTFDRQILLRGVYFTSGTQEGTPIDRLMGALARRYAVAPDAVSPPTGRGKAYFIERLLKDVMIAESGLAGVNRRLELKKAAAQLGAYAAIVLIAVIVIGGLIWSYSRNRTYIGQVATDVDRLQQVPPVALSAPVESLVPRLDVVRTVVDSASRHQGNVPLGMRWGLYQGNSLSNAARDAYGRELDVSLLPRVANRFEQRLTDYGAEPEKLYEYLKAYLMLGQPKQLDPAHVALLADVEWNAEYASQPDMAAAVSKHFRTLLANPESLPASPNDANLIARARSTIRQASIPQLVYSRLKLNYADDAARDVHLEIAAGVGAEQVFRRKSGTPLSRPVPAIYTAPVFHEVVATGLSEVTKQFADEQWVWGEGGQPATRSGTLSRDVLAVYEDDYIAAWDGVLNDLQLVSTSGSTSAASLLAKLGGRTSPLRGLLQTVDTNTYLLKAATPAQPEGAIGAAKRRTTETLDKLLGAGKQAVPQGAPPGTRVTMHFDPIHQLVTGAPGSAPIDPVLDLLGRLGQQLSTVGGSTVGNKSGIADPGGSNELLRNLKSEVDRLPDSVGALVSQAYDRSTTAVRAGIRSDLGNRYQQEVVSQCREVVSGNYPFVAGSATDAPPGDVARLFGDQGVFDTFFRTNLEQLVDTSRAPWSWRTDVSGAAVGGSPGMLRQFEAARRIRDIFFPAGSQGPTVQFNVTPTYLDQGALGVVLEIDGQRFDYRHGPVIQKRAVWPGPSPGAASISFEDRTTSRPSREFKGPWAMFRLLDSAQARAETVTRHQFTFQLGGHEARAVVEAQSVRNPFATRELQQFRCEI